MRGFVLVGGESGEQKVVKRAQAVVGPITLEKVRRGSREDQATVRRKQILENLKELWYHRQHWWLGRQHLFQHFLMTPTAEGARVRSMFQILQFNIEYGTNFVFGIGTRDDMLIREDGVWVFKKLLVNAWRSLEDVPWKGDLLMKGRPAMTPPRHSLDDEAEVLRCLVKTAG